MPEPIFAETVTDIDGRAAGELEIEANGSELRSRKAGAQAQDASLEVELLVTRRLGFRLEPSIARDRLDGTAPWKASLGASGGASWKLFQDFEHDFHLQGEVEGRLPWDELAIAQPGDPALPLAVDLRAGIRRDVWTLRSSVGYGFDGDAAHLPVRTSLAVLLPFEGSARLGSWGMELDIDGARPAPLIGALELQPNLAPVGLPFRFALALPWNPGEREDRPSVGIFVRLFFESEREIEFAQGAH